jgi:hypothetical protein
MIGHIGHDQEGFSNKWAEHKEWAEKKAALHLLRDAVGSNKNVFWWSLDRQKKKGLIVL